MSLEEGIDSGGGGTAPCMSEILSELLICMYSDEGTPIGAIGTQRWPTLYEQLVEWLIRAN